MKTYKELSEAKREQLKKFPAYISLLAATYHQHGMDKKEKQEAIRFTHVKSFKPDPMLSEFYDDVEKDFEQTLIMLNDRLPKDKKEREAVIKVELEKLERILKELGTDFADSMHRSMESYKEHVGHSHDSLFEYLVFPIPIKGLTY